MKQYMEPVMNVICFEKEDVLTTSLIEGAADCRGYKAWSGIEFTENK